MKKMILQLCALGLLFALGQGLKCYECKFGVMSVCLTSVVECKTGEQCSQTAYDAGGLKFNVKGCVETTNCNASTMLDNYIKSDRKCCDQDLCNAAPGLAGFSGLGLGVATITALLITQVLV